MGEDGVHETPHVGFEDGEGDLCGGTEVGGVVGADEDCEEEGWGDVGVCGALDDASEGGEDGGCCVAGLGGLV